MMIATASVFARNEDCPVREIGGGLVIMAPQGNMTHSLEGLGAFIWQHLDGRRDLSAVLDAITSEYDVEREVAAADLFAFVNELAEAGIITQTS
jgi:hypothetical protein